jgi:hypothetical protein
MDKLCFSAEQNEVFAALLLTSLSSRLTHACTIEHRAELAPCHLLLLLQVQTIRSGTRVVIVPKVVMPGEQRSLAVRWAG